MTKIAKVIAPVKSMFTFFVIKNPKILKRITILDIAFSFCSIDINGAGHISIISSLLNNTSGSFIQNCVDDNRFSMLGTGSG